LEVEEGRASLCSWLHESRMGRALQDGAEGRKWPTHQQPGADADCISSEVPQNGRGARRMEEDLKPVRSSPCT